MKKKMNMAAAILLSSVMAVSAGFAAIPAVAADPTYTITMSTTANHTYTAYQVFAGVLHEETTGTGESAVTTKTLTNVTWGSGVDGTALLAALKSSTANPTYYADFENCDSAAKVAKVLEGYNNDSAQIKAIAKIIEAHKATGTTTLTGLAAGYYLITDTTTTLPTDADGKTSDTYSSFILRVVDNVEVTAKDGTVESHKTVTETDDTTPTTTPDQKVADYDIGDAVPYKLTFKLPSNYAEYVNYPITFTDDMCAGLTWDGNATIYYGSSDTTGTDIQFTTTTGSSYYGGQKWTFTTPDLKTESGLTAGSVVTVIYNATLDSDAAINNDGNENKYHVTFYSNPNVSTTPGPNDTTTPPPPTNDTPDDTTVVFTYELVFNKVDENKGALAGANFKLEKNVGGTWTDVTALHTGEGAINPTLTDKTTGADVTPGTTTSFSFKGLDAGSYKLTETATPNTYNSIDPITFEVVATKSSVAVTGLSSTSLTMTSKFDDDDAKLSADIENKKGSVLPSTGGIGTTIFYVVGGSLVGLAVVLLITKRRMNAKEK